MNAPRPWPCWSAWLVLAVVALCGAPVLAQPTPSVQDAPPPAEAPAQAPTQAPQDDPAEARDFPQPTGQPGPGARAVVILADGDVDNFMRDGIRARLTRAREEHAAEVVVLQLNTYGGLVTAGIEISNALKQQPDLHIVAFVDEKAISAGAMIAVAADEIVMQPNSLLGDAGVIAMGSTGGPAEMDTTARAKAESLVLGAFRDSALQNGYDPLLLDSMIVVDRVVYAIEHLETGERRFVTAADYERLVAEPGEAAAWRTVPNLPVPLVDNRTLLTVNNVDAAVIGLSQGTYRTVDEFLASRGYVYVTTLAPTSGERVIGFLSSMGVRSIMMLVLFFGLYMAFSQPGTGLPEAAVVMALGVLVGVPMLTGYAQWYEIILVLLGIALIAVEIFLLPGFGVAGITGLAMLFMGLSLTFVAPILPTGLPVGFGVDWSRLGDGMFIVVLGMVCSLLLWFWLSRYLPKLPYARHMILTDDGPATPEEAAAAAAESAGWPSLGTVGVAVTDLRPGGTARFHITPDPDDTANADVVSDRGFVAAGSRLQVVEVRGNRVVVRPTEP